MGTPRRNRLAIILGVDGLLSSSFGLASYFSATSTYATIVDLSGMREDSLMVVIAILL